MTDKINPNSEESAARAALQRLHETPARDAGRAEAGRAAFLAEAERMKPAVSPAAERRHTGRIHWIPTLFARKDAQPMLKFALPILLILALVLGTGITTAAAQAALPGDTLYPVKLWTEDARLDLAASPAALLDLHLQFADKRIDEAAQLLAASQTPPEALFTRLELHLNYALQFAADQEEPGAREALEQLRQRMETQVRTMTQIMPNEPKGEAALARLQETVQNRLRVVESGIEDPVQLREQLRSRFAQPTEDPTGDPTQGGGYGPGDPGNPWTTGTPTPGSGYGPGEPQNPWTTGTPTPGSGYGPGDPGNPWTTGTPTPGSGYGPGEPVGTPGGPRHP